MSVEGWLTHLYTLCAEDKTLESISYIDSLVEKAGKLMVSRCMAQADFERLSMTAVVRFIYVTVPIRDELPARDAFYKRAYPRLRKVFQGPARDLLDSWR